MSRIVFLLVVLTIPSHLAAQGPTREQAREAMLRAARFFRSISTEGGYLWRYSLDLKTRQGEGPATDTQVWVQPPGTPAVGQAFLRAYRATGEREFLDAAVAAARALVRGQLESGGWDYRIEFNPAERKKWNYRLDPSPGARNISTYDDDNTQAALRLLMAVYKTRPDAETKAALDYGLEALLKSQYPNGGWPQRYPGPPEGYYRYYTYNDNTIADLVRTMTQAWQQFGDKRHLEAVRRAGDFMILSQRPEPQPVWAQQYDLEMKPAWARKFEPPSVCSGESAGVIRSLIQIYLVTADEKYLKPIPAAIAWFRRSEIAPGRWARFYELQTNKPLYFTKKYELVYTDNDLPTHYAFQSAFGVPDTIAEYEALEKARRQGGLKAARALYQRTPAKPDAARVRQILDTLDSQGRWVTNDWIECRVFIRNINALSDFLKPENDPILDPHAFSRR